MPNSLLRYLQSLSSDEVNELKDYLDDNYPNDVVSDIFLELREL
jgi:hypothetical protein